MAHRMHLPWGAHQWPSAPGQATGPAVAPMPDAEAQIVHAFELAAVGYLLAVLGPVLLLFEGTIPREAMDGWVDIYFTAGCLPLGLSVLAAVLYGLPRAMDSRLWSTRLAWCHFALLNTAVLLPVWRLVAEHGSSGASLDRLLALVVIGQAAGVVAMLANLLESVATLRVDHR